MATNRNSKLVVSKRTLFRFSGKEAAGRAISTDPTTVTITSTFLAATGQVTAKK
ncbi:hypothetical protein [Pontibacter chinhatensis]|uniref:Uncharacterized protein n=1 Tax=Pontibacter chinhatensis TaxID=1436961 RepID=A0A1I2NCM7_9BACT|nr:hypothetical protein [Pontibacter chinhatensis]SFF99236.1 hypothetical protein SAMN05421739_101614 [Pontibacter chinhatensis]